MAFTHEQWRRLADGRMRATFNSHAELLLCLAAVGRPCAWNEGS